MDARSETNDQTATPAGPLSNDKQRAGERRRQLFVLLGLAVLVGAVLYAVYWVLVASHHVKTDDAYVDTDTASVTPLVAGAIVDAPIYNTQHVVKGQVLVRIDPTDYQIALAEDQAALGQAERKVQGYFANNDALAADVTARQADIAKAQAELVSAQADDARARTDLQRRQALAPAGAVSGDELTAAQNRQEQTIAAVAGAKAGLAQAKANQIAAMGQQRVSEALISGEPVESNPEVAAARAKVDQAKLDLSRTIVRSPVDGIVAKNVIEVGQRVQVGAEMMSIVPVQDAYIDANFKEGQLKHVCVGLPVTLTSDRYGSGVKFHGKVVGVSGGTGSAFAIIPAQNATGNWIKVVQRLPVRVALDPSELTDHPLRVGLSMNVDIDTAGGCAQVR